VIGASVLLPSAFVHERMAVRRGVDAGGSVTVGERG